MINVSTDVREHNAIAKIVQHYTDVSRNSPERAHDIDEGDVSSFSTALRATSLVILLMLSLAFVSALLATRPAFATVEQSWTRIMQTYPPAHR